MGILNKLFGKDKIEKPTLKIDLNESGIYINENEISFPTTISKLIEILGLPTRQYYEDNYWRIVWDNLGICTDGGLSNILDLRLVIKPESKLKHLPEGMFQGTVLVNGQSIDNFQDEIIKVKKYEIVRARYKGDTSNDFYCYLLTKNYDYKEQQNKEKYKLHKTSGEKIEFSDFNFKLAIIEELVYNKKLLKPKFDIYEFAEIQEIKGFSAFEGGYDPLPEAVEYFNALEIDKNLAEQVTDINQDGGNEIYMNVTPQWDGEDDIFNIHSFEDVRHFPNLKKMTLFEADQKIIEELKSKGIDAQPL